MQTAVTTDLQLQYSLQNSEAAVLMGRDHQAEMNAIFGRKMDIFSKDGDWAVAAGLDLALDRPNHQCAQKELESQCGSAF